MLDYAENAVYSFSANYFMVGQSIFLPDAVFFDRTSNAYSPRGTI